MAMVVKNNMSALSALNTLNTNTTALSKSLKKVSSGMKINSAADDASGYAISEKMRVNIRSLNQANANAQNGSSMMKVAEGAVSSTVEILKTLKEKAINAANDTNTDADRQTIQKELDQSIDQIDDNANVTFNGKYLVDGSKNSAGKATYTALTNQSLSQDTTADTKLVDLTSRSGDSLELSSTDKVTVSYVQAGKTYSASFTVGDKTLQDIFNAAEDIDKDSKIFASSDNEAVQAAGGATGTSTDAEKKAIDYLKGQLANGNSAATTAADIVGTSAYAGGGTAGTIKYGAGATALQAQGYKDPNGDDYAQGELHHNLIEADKAMKKAEDAIGTYSSTAATGTAGTLGNALKSAGIAWDGTAAGFNSKEIQTKLEAAYGDTSVDSEALKNAVKAYTDDVADYDKAKAGVDDAAKAYGEAQKQLAALTAQDTLNSKVDAANTLKDALVTVFKSKMEELATTDPAKKITYSDINSFDATNGSVDSETVHTSVDNNAENREKAVAAFEDALNKAMNIKGKEKDAVTALVDKFLYDTTKMTDATGFGDAAKAVGTARDAVTGVANDLKAAQEQVVSKFSGPAVLTGNTVGVNAAGNVVETASGEKGITITANQAGIGGQISGFNISVSDSEGKVKKSANASLDAFSETVRAQNKSEDNAVSLQVGANANQSIKIGLTDMRSEALGLKGADGTTLNISTQTKANAAINVLDNALAKALDQQTTIGSVESRLEYTQSNLTTASENVTAAESVIRDADMAKEMTEYTKNNVLMQAAQSMLSQANQSASNALSLLQ